MILRLCVITILFVITFSASYAQIYRYIDDNGQVAYSSVQPAGSNSSEQLSLRDNSVETPEISEDGEAAAKVVIYTTTWCGICKRAKAYFDNQSIDYTEYDVEKDSKGKADYARMGGRGVPIILVGDSRLNGFDKGRFQRLYDSGE